MTGSRWRWTLLGVAIVAVALLIASALVRGCTSGPEAQPTLAEDPPTGAVLVDLEDDAGGGLRAQVAARLAEAIAPFDWPGGEAGLGQLLSADAQLYRLTPPPSERAEVLAFLTGRTGVEAVELERVWSLPEGSPQGIPLDTAVTNEVEPSRGPRRFVPDDPYFVHQWNLEQIGMPVAWTHTRGAGITVAVVDTGVLYRTAGRFVQVPDLGRTEMVDGYDFVDGDAFPDDEHGHGTHVAGTVAQSTDNGLGVAGVAFGARLMPVRVLDGGGAGRWGAVAAGIRWAADHGADVINLSLGGGTPSRVIQRAIVHAHERGVVVVAAAGNTGQGRVGYPAAHEHVIAVGAVRCDETLTRYSSYGEALDIAAPGGDLTVDQNGDGLPDGILQNTMVGRDPARHDYLALQGTSMASPHVAAAAALVRALGVRDPDAVEAVLTATAKDRGDPLHYGAGTLRVDEAVARASRGRAGLDAVAAVALCLLLLAGPARRRRLGVSVAGSAAAAFLLAGGLALAPWSWAGGPWLDAAVRTLSLPGLLGDPHPSLAPLALSALPALAAAGLLLGVRRAGTVVAGVAFAVAGCLLVEAFVPRAWFGPWPGLLVGPWLLANAALAAWLGRASALRSF